jgi:hypothetical protein
MQYLYTTNAHMLILHNAVCFLFLTQNVADPDPRSATLYVRQWTYPTPGIQLNDGILEETLKARQEIPLCRATRFCTEKK